MNPANQVTADIIDTLQATAVTGTVVVDPAVAQRAAMVERTFCCPITTDLMVDPVVCPDGHSFERAAIEEWLETSQTNPVTRQRLTKDMLAPNRALKDSIDLYVVVFSVLA